MQKRKLGNSDITIAPIAFGGNVFGWTLDEKASFEILDAFVDAGFDFIDTADTYSHWARGNTGGESETIIGKWMKLRNNRDKVIIATKVGGAPDRNDRSLAPNHIRETVESSLRRLQTDYIDLYQSHYDDLKTPIEETLKTYAELVKEGKVRWIGASNFSAERLAQSLEISRQNNFPAYQTLQPLYNLYEREPFEKELEAVCLENNISVISYYSLASGFLSGKYRSENDLSKSARGEGVKKYLNERGFRILSALDNAAEKYNTSPAAMSLAWLLAKPAVAAPIASATSRSQLDSFTEAVQINPDTETIALLDKASAWK